MLQRIELGITARVLEIICGYYSTCKTLRADWHCGDIIGALALIFRSSSGLVLCIVASSSAPLYANLAEAHEAKLISPT